jgi:transposase InsO family protein
LVKRCHL